jgi:hypothetical protein
MKNILFLIVLLWTSFAWTQKTDHSIWNELLKKNVSSEGKVNYIGFKNELNQLDAYLLVLQKNQPSAKWTEDEKKAFWINAYNAHTIKMILNHYPVSSIMDIKENSQSAFDFKWIELGKTKISLNDIENTKLRAVFKDPRIHFALNCASVACPILWNKAYTSQNMESALQNQAKKFINDKTKNNFSKSRIEISELFKWYAEDFGDVIKFLNQYSTISIDEKSTIAFTTYNWKLNE